MNEEAAELDRLTKVKRIWGMCFRALFIAAVGYIGYNLVEPKDIRNVPISQLTLRDIFDAFYAMGVAMGCVIWLFRPPKDNPENRGSDLDPYLWWSSLSFMIPIVVAIIAIIITGFCKNK